MLILAAAAAVRFQGLGRLELWHDECHAVITARSPLGILHELRQDSNAPLYFFVLRLWTAVFGISAEGVRSLSATLGLAAVACVGLWVRALGMPRGAALWALGLASGATLQVYYSQEARGYTLVFLLVSLAGMGLARAVASGRAGWWVAHGAALALALFAHDLCLAFVPAAWLAAWALGTDRRGWKRLALCHAAVLSVYGPYLAYVLAQPKGPALAWIEPLWRALPPALALPRSVEALGVAGHTPAYIRLVPPDLVVRLLSGAVTIVCLAGCVSWLMQGGPDTAVAERRAVRRGLVALSAFAFVPLLSQFGYSLAIKPIYVVARYDTLAQPAFLGLLAAGALAVQRALARVSAPAGVLPAIAVVALAIHPLAQRAVPLDDDLVYRPQQVRGEILTAEAGADDLIVCMGLEATRIAYQMLLRDIPADLVTFPLSTRRHMGWFVPEAVLAEGRERLEGEAHAILNGFFGPDRRYRRLWVVMDPYSGTPQPPGRANPYAEISGIFLGMVARRGLLSAGLSTPEKTARAEAVGLRLFEAP
ncbi:MAG: glycosyltransferase family 39 protein [Candidatus Sumerlaeaceae bacterium]|nr:glycosyltransferase family 39 protein [Candidatus Sumerlaeaceae bacterium]